MSTMSVKAALAEVLKDMRAMSADKLREDLLAHRNGPLATALRDAENFVGSQISFSLHFEYPLKHIQSLLHGDFTGHAEACSLDCLLQLSAANESPFALAA